MDDIMILMNAINIDIQGFNDTQFGIFNDSDQEKLLHIWNNLVNQDINKFIGKLTMFKANFYEFLHSTCYYLFSISVFKVIKLLKIFNTDRIL